MRKEINEPYGIMHLVIFSNFPFSDLGSPKQRRLAEAVACLDGLTDQGYMMLFTTSFSAHVIFADIKCSARVRRRAMRAKS